MSQSKPVNKTTPKKSKKALMHPRNPHNQSYDFEALSHAHTPLAAFVAKNKYGTLSIDFKNEQAVMALNTALIKHFYQLSAWHIPTGFLCPAVPGRADYIHYLADLLAQDDLPNHPTVRALDIGTGANLIYPIIGHKSYGWSFVASELDQVALQNAQSIIDNNDLNEAIGLRKQSNEKDIFKHLIQSKDQFDVTLCNPPFHKSAQEANASSQRKLDNLSGEKHTKKYAKQHSRTSKHAKPEAASQSKAALNFGGQAKELWCDGGELLFIKRMMQQSCDYSNQCRWFTTLVSKKENVGKLKFYVKRFNVTDFKIVEMKQGNKISRFIAWTWK